VQAGVDQPLARLTGDVASPLAAALYYHQDGLSSVLAVTDAAKAVTATQRFDAFGNKIGGANSVRQYGYTGREPDASGLIYYRARYYDPNQTRFTQRDPLGYADGINPYSYVHNNPVNFNDPSGLLARSVVTFVDTQATSYVNARNELYGTIGGYLYSTYQSINFPDYLSVSIPTPIPWVGANVTIDQYGSVYSGLGVGMGYPNVGVAIGWKIEEGKTIWNTPNPTPEELGGFLSGLGYGMGAGLGLNWTLTDQALTIMTPGLGATYSWNIFDLKDEEDNE